VLTAEGADRANLEVLSLRSGERKLLVRGGTYGRYLPNGYLTYVNQGTLYAVAFDANRLAVEGAPVPLLQDVAYSRTFGHAQLDVANSGTLIYHSSPAPGQFVVEWLDRDGSSAPLLNRPGRYNWLRLSPDGQRLALSVAEAGVPSIWIHHLGSGGTDRIGVADESSGLTWWPQADLLVFGSFRGMAWSASERSGSPNPLSSGTVLQVPWSISPDGSRLAYHELNPATGFDLWTVAISATPEGLELGAADPFLRTSAFEVYPSFSPDGRWLAYASNESGGFEVYVRRFPDDGTRVRVSRGGGRVSHWSPNGREILYQTDEQRLMVASYRVEDGTFVVDSAHLWAPQPIGDTGVLPGFDIAPDGERVAALMPAAISEHRQAQNYVTVLVNFFDEVQRRAGRGGR
jgi:eukaryotic-like serine/threonine-protein kinase